MRYVEDSIHVDAAPAEVWSWIAHMADHYAEWHPDHVFAEWISGPPNRVGSVLRAVETLGGHNEDLLFEVIAFDAPHHFAYRIGRSIGLVMPRGSFDIESDEDGGCWFTARIGYRFGAMTEMIFQRRMSVLRDHLAQEGVNLKRLVETAA